MKLHSMTALVLSVLVFFPAQAAERPRASPRWRSPPFIVWGLYWSPPDGAADKEVQVRYRRQGDIAVEGGPAHALQPHPRDRRGPDRLPRQHRPPAAGHHLRNPADSGRHLHAATSLTATTWSEDFPIGETVRVADRDTPLAITESGTPDAYRVYDGRGATIDVRHQHDQCITIDASYVIVRGFTLKGAGAGETARGRPIGAIQIEGGHDIVIEDCDISDWGRLNPKTGFGCNYDSAIFSRSSTLERLIVQRCKLHHPRWNGSTWYEPISQPHDRAAVHHAVQHRAATT